MARTLLYVYILLLCINSLASVFNIPIQNKNQDKANSVDSKEDTAKAKQETEHVPQINISNVKQDENKIEKKPTAENTNTKEMDDKKNTKDSTNSNLPTPKVLENSSNIKNSPDPDSEIESGAVMRGIFVFVGITMLFIMYVAFKTYRRRNKKNVLIKKYGVRTRRSDMEMEPLPLDEDEDDETVFDLGNVNNR